MGVNETILTGHTGRDSDLRYMASGVAFASFSLAYDAPQSAGDEAETLWINVVMWGPMAEGTSPLISKGDYVKVRGSLRARSWADKATGEKQYRIELAAEHVRIYPRRESSDPGPASGQSPARHAQRYEQRRAINQQQRTEARPGPAADDDNAPFE